MSLVKETGSLATSTVNTFVDINDWNTYWEDRDADMEADVTYDEDDIVAALLKAADYMGGLNWKGRTHYYYQRLCWPRIDVVDESGWLWDEDRIPDAVKEAQIQLAKLELETSGTLFPNLARGGRIKRKKTDVLETEYFDGASSRTTFTHIQHLLHGLLNIGISRRIMRA